MAGRQFRNSLTYVMLDAIPQGRLTIIRLEKKASFIEILLENFHDIFGLNTILPPSTSAISFVPSEIFP